MAEMKALLRFPGERKVVLADCPVPIPGDHDILVQTCFSVISPGTEFTQVRQATASLWQKAWQRPDLVALTLKSLATSGAKATASRVTNQLGRPMPLGYSAIGRIERIGAKADGFYLGQRVAIAGMGHASHAQWNRVPVNMACPVPDSVPDHKAAFATLYALALHGLRQGKTTIGDKIAIIGAGLIGQLLVQTARASGARTTIIEPNPLRRQLAQKNGAHGGMDHCRHAPDNSFDAVYICAAARGMHALIDQAARMCRDRGTIICLGDVNISAHRKTLYDKEISIHQVRSYGPGRYDPAYEELGHDYPLGYVRWTIKRNMQAALDLMADGKLDPSPLITSKIAFADIADHFAKGPSQDQLATLVSYDIASQPTEQIPPTPPTPPTDPRVHSIPKPRQPSKQQPPIREASPVTLGLIGTGNYLGSQLVPYLKKCGNADIVACCSRDGLSAMAVARKFGNARALTAANEIFENPAINSVMIATRHDSHAALAADALKSGKHVWLEKPIAITRDGLALLHDCQSAMAPDAIFMIGHNRRYAGMTAKLKDALPDGPKHFRYRVRVTPLGDRHWLNNPEQGGRTLGEITHFIDLIASLNRTEISDIRCQWLDRSAGDSIWTIRFEDGSQGDISYQHSTRREPKEILQIDAPGFDAQLTDWRKLSINGRTVMRTYFGQDKGHRSAIETFVDAIASGRQDRLMPGLEDEIKLMALVINAACY
ncbi:bi-domain-containing oxidoreductase [Thalassospira sp. GO-4]|uniref:bi-domain-containing oxidoreductase n=1 Tax=Thalassospira sp. GO-4 TaxID=2946605 RepID=UPI002024CF88|nr:bi-domain-containing oxidoreductase [Thalassospira sp. GO-4]URK19302.1 bi-domain-containing oxidoreductase [Thalassospira sp. GO-4]